MPQYFALNPAVFNPRMSLIASITQAPNALVTTTATHGLISGTIVRLVVPPTFGMQQIDQQVSTIVVLTPTSFQTGINSINYDPYVVPTPNPQFPACGQVVPIGELNSMLTAAVQNDLPLPAS